MGWAAPVYSAHDLCRGTLQSVQYMDVCEEVPAPTGCSAPAAAAVITSLESKTVVW